MAKAEDTAVFYVQDTVSPQVTTTTEAPPQVTTTTEAPPQVTTTTEAPPQVTTTTEASPEDILALEEFLTSQLPYQTRAEPKKKTGIYGETAEIARLAVGVALLGGFSILQFSTGHVAMGIFLVLCAAFAVAMIWAALNPAKPSDTSDPISLIERLRVSGELDALAMDFPHEAQDSEDRIRLGEYYLFNRYTRKAHSYMQIERLEFNELKTGMTPTLFLKATYTDGKNEALYNSRATPEGYARVNDICQHIQRANPFVRIG